MHGEAGLSLTFTATMGLRETSTCALQGTEAGSTAHRRGTLTPAPPD